MKLNVVMKKERRKSKNKESKKKKPNKLRVLSKKKINKNKVILNILTPNQGRKKYKNKSLAYRE